MTEELLEKIKNYLRLYDVDEAIPIINQCIQARDNIFSRNTCTDPDFEVGSLVLDTRDGEIGFVVGPINMYGDISKPDVKLSYGEINKKSTILIVTRNTTIKDTSSYSSSNFRVRYIKKEFLVPIKLENNSPYNPKTSNDLNEFCSKQCIMECTSECKLYKYKKKK